MKLTFVINALDREQPTYTTQRLLHAAHNHGHEAWLMQAGGFIYNPDGSIHARARRGTRPRYDSPEELLTELQKDKGTEQHIALDDLDVLWLRNDPAEDLLERPWAATAPILFGQLAARRGVLVLNDPLHLGQALNKTYFQQFPASVRPRTFISRDLGELRQFILDHGDDVVIKPLQGSGGQSVFLVRDHELTNLNQMLEAVTRDGYCVVQEYLPAAAEGDVRLFLMNGIPLERDGKVAAFRRVNNSGDMRSNMHVGGEGEAVELDAKAYEMAEAIRPKLQRDGMFLVGVDIVKDKLMEVNVFSPGGLGSIKHLTGVDFTLPILEDLQRKVDLRRSGERGPNTRLATA